MFAHCRMKRKEEFGDRLAGTPTPCRMPSLTAPTRPGPSEKSSPTGRVRHLRRDRFKKPLCRSDSAALKSTDVPKRARITTHGARIIRHSTLAIDATFLQHRLASVPAKSASSAHVEQRLPRPYHDRCGWRTPQNAPPLGTSDSTGGGCASALMASLWTVSKNLRSHLRHSDVLPEEARVRELPALPCCRPTMSL